MKQSSRRLPTIGNNWLSSNIIIYQKIAGRYMLPLCISLTSWMSDSCTADCFLMLRYLQQRVTFYLSSKCLRLIQSEFAVDENNSSLLNIRKVQVAQFCVITKMSVCKRFASPCCFRSQAGCSSLTLLSTSSFMEWWIVPTEEDTLLYGGTLLHAERRQRGAVFWKILLRCQTWSQKNNRYRFERKHLFWDEGIFSPLLDTFFTWFHFALDYSKISFMRKAMSFKSTEVSRTERFRKIQSTCLTLAKNCLLFQVKM